MIEDLGTSGRREHDFAPLALCLFKRLFKGKMLTPDGKDGLEDKVHRNPVQNRTETHRFGKVHRAEDDLVLRQHPESSPNP